MRAFSAGGWHSFCFRDMWRGACVFWKFINWFIFNLKNYFSESMLGALFENFKMNASMNAQVSIYLCTWVASSKSNIVVQEVKIYIKETRYFAGYVSSWLFYLWRASEWAFSGEVGYWILSLKRIIKYEISWFSFMYIITKHLIVFFSGKVNFGKFSAYTFLQISVYTCMWCMCICQQFPILRKENVNVSHGTHNSINYIILLYI